MKPKQKLLISILFFLIFVSSALAVTADEISIPNGFVNDFVGVLSADEKATLETQVRQIQSDTTVEIGIAIVDSTNGRDISEFAFDLGNQWKIGKTDKFNGVLILIAVNDRKWFIATAKGIEGTLPDVVAHNIGEENFPPNFRENDYFTGLSNALTDLQGYVENDPAIVSKYSSSQSSLESAFSGNWFFPIFLGLIFLPVLFMHGAKTIGQAPGKGLVAFDILAVVLAVFFLGFNTDVYLVIGTLLLFFNLFALVLFYGKHSGSGGWHSGGLGGGGSSGGGGFGGGGGFSGGGGGGRW